MGTRRGWSVMGFCFPGLDAKGGDLPPDKFRAKVPFLSVLPDEQNEFQIGKKRKHWLAPQFGAFATWRQVAAFGVKARETEAHSHDGDDLRIVENLFTDAEPAAQADA
jgi:hypothetical protein